MILIMSNKPIIRFTWYNVSVGNYEVEKKDGRIVVPVTMMVPGVHNGSHGPVLNSAEELGRFVESWNGIPIVINHPMDGSGVYESANQVERENQVVGRVYNAVFEENGLRGEAWIDPEVLSTNDETLLERISNGEIIEVSVGVFNDLEEGEGEWRGEQYIAVARNYRPDHLALLPNDRGACSVADGCGIRVHMELKDKYSIIVNQGFQEIARKLQMFLDTMDTPEAIHYLEEVFETDFVFFARTRDGAITYYKMNYTSNESTGTVTADEDSKQQVAKRTTYPVVANTESINDNKQKLTKGGNDMPSSNHESCQCQEKINSLIGAKIGFSEEDRKMLEGLPEGTIDTLISNAISKTEPETKEEEKTETQTTQEQVPETQNLKEAETKKEIGIQDLSPALRSQIAFAERVHSQVRGQWLQELKEAQSEYSESDLNAMSTEELEKLRKLVYSIKGTSESSVTGNADVVSQAYLGKLSGNSNITTHSETPLDLTYQEKEAK